MYVTYTRIYGWSDYGGESSYQPGYRLENMMWMTLLVYDYIIPGEKLCILYRTARKSAVIYECKKCGYRFLSLQTMKKIACPDCESEIDYEIGPDESMENVIDTAELLEKIEGEEEVEKMDTLLSLAITGGDESWI